MKRSGSRKVNMKQVAFTRFMLVVAVFVLWIGGISVRLVHLQVTQHAWLKEQALKTRQNVNNTRMLRGTIFDRNGRTLAMSVRVKTLYANPFEIADIESTARSIANALSQDPNAIATQLRQGKEAKKKYVVIANKLDEDAVQKVNKALDQPEVRKADLPNFTGLHWEDKQKRSYPNNTLAAQIVGFSNDADDGVAGIEKSQDDILQGAIVQRRQERDRLGRVYDEEIIERDTPSDVVLTIDWAYQHMVEESLEKGVHAAGAKSGIAIVMSPKTGEIFALANYPTFDPNNVTQKDFEDIRNEAVQSVYSPGSVFKLITYGSALEKKLIDPNGMVDSGNGTIEVAKHVFTDSHQIGRVSYSQAMAHSSNVCAIKTAMSVGSTDFAAMMKKMGFGSRTGIELPAETPGVVRPVEKWYGDSLASMAIGYEVDVTALQMTSAFATIANNGVRVKPRIIKEIRRSDEQPRAVTQVEQTQVVTAETSRNLRTMLKQVVLTGTGRRAQLNGYTAAGKTGTAWKFNARSKSIDRSKYISSFIGMAPADDPEIVVAVIMDEPTVGARDGGTVSAPVFREIAQRLLFEMKVPTDAPIRQEQMIAKDIPEIPVSGNSDKNGESVDKRSEDKAADKSKRPINTVPPTDKDKSKDQKKTKETKEPEVGKLTAFLKRRFDVRELGWIDITKVET